jgi:hypothetical protein
MMDLNPQVRGGYSRNRGKYEEALYARPSDFLIIARWFCDALPGPELYAHRGNDGFPFADHLFVQLLRVYHSKSLRWASGYGNLVLGHKDDFGGPRYPRAAAMSEFMRAPELEPFIQTGLLFTAYPMTSIGGGTRLAMDMSGFGTNHFFDYRLDRRNKGDKSAGERDILFDVDGRRHVRPYMRANALSCVDTLATTAVVVTDQHVHEGKVVPELCEPTLRLFEKGDLLGDGGYRNDEREWVAFRGWRPFFRYPSNAVEPRKNEVLRALYNAMEDDPEKWIDLYRFRVKNNFSAFFRCVEGHGPVNEIMLKFLCMNIVMLGYAMRIYGLDVRFFGSEINIANLKSE